MRLWVARRHAVNLLYALFSVKLWFKSIFYWLRGLKHCKTGQSCSNNNVDDPLKSAECCNIAAILNTTQLTCASDAGETRTEPTRAGGVVLRKRDAFLKVIFEEKSVLPKPKVVTAFEVLHLGIKIVQNYFGMENDEKQKS